jgi:hypothetical protein
MGESGVVFRFRNGQAKPHRAVRRNSSKLVPPGPQHDTRTAFSNRWRESGRQVYRVFSEEELRGIKDEFAWLRAAERSFEFWDNEEDGVYDRTPRLPDAAWSTSDR